MTRAQRLCDLCVSVAGVTGAALVVGSGEGRSTVCVTDGVSDRLEELQFTLSEGPAVSAEKDGWSVLAPDLSDGSQRRWPVFAPAAIEVGARAAFALPVRLGAIRLGVLSTYRSAPGNLSADELNDAQSLANAAAVLLCVGTGTHAAEAFMWAVGDGSRFQPQVHQAVGATVVQLSVSAREAFALMCAHAFATGLPIADVAEDIMAKRMQLESD
ncbi:MAG: GAF and ANTAR domain-containing protein [Nocardioidaceae bacterium]